MKLTQEQLDAVAIKDDHTGVKAFLDSEVIGRVDVEEDFQDNTAIFSMEVEPDYRRNGIGMRMIQRLHEIYGKLVPPPTIGPNAVTDEGARLINKAIDSGFVHPWPHTVNEYEDEEL